MAEKTKTRIELLAELRAELFDYVNLRARLGTPLSFERALRGHREQVIENLRDDGDPMWRDRLSLLDQICVEEGVA
jgi:hypothetical protein